MFRKKKILSREQSLAARPVRNSSLDVSRDEQGHVVLTFHRRKTWWANALARLFGMPDSKKVALDEIGTAVWEQCDGKHSVQAIIDNFAAKYRLNRREAEVSMVAYLKQLTQRGIIGLVVDGSDSRGNGPKAGGGREKEPSRKA